MGRGVEGMFGSTWCGSEGDGVVGGMEGKTTDKKTGRKKNGVEKKRKNERVTKKDEEGKNKRRKR